jgi:hypothetical protein
VHWNQVSKGTQGARRTHLVLHLAVGHEERAVDTEDGTLDDGILEVEARQVVANTNLQSR